jgi:hypothetical protein
MFHNTLWLLVDKNWQHFGTWCNNITTNQPPKCVNKITKNLEIKWGVIKHNISRFVGCHGFVVAMNKSRTLKNYGSFFENFQNNIKLGFIFWKFSTKQWVF